jgi:hypothetical protein
MHAGFSSGNLKVNNHLEDLSVVGRITLQWLLKKGNCRIWTGFILLRIGRVAGCCECRNESK